jgi:hypothetical protein
MTMDLDTIVKLAIYRVIAETARQLVRIAAFSEGRSGR